jgi:hypothetical protein
MTNLLDPISGFETVNEFKKAVQEISFKALVNLNDPRITRSSTYCD